MDRRIVHLALALLALSWFALRSYGAPGSSSGPSAQQNWPQWRGPHATGVSDATGLPATWSPTQNIVWKTPMPSWSAGTPIIWGDRIFVTSPTAADAGQPPAAQQGQRAGADGPGGGGFGLGGPGGPGGPRQPGQILPAFIQQQLNLTAEQKQQLEELQIDADARLAKILTDNQKQQLAQARQRGPGGFGPGGPGGPGGGFGRGRGGGLGGGPGFGGGRGGRDPGGSKLLLLCLSRKDGTELWRRELDEGNQIYNKQNSSSPSPVTDGKHVWVVTGTGAVTAFNMDGKTIWQHHLQSEYGRFGLNWGYASSPLLYNGKLIIQVLHGMRTADASYIVAFDSQSGKELWRQERPTDAVAESHDAYTTPALLQSGGKTQIVIAGGDYVTGHDPETGKELWRAGGLNPQKRANYRIVASPLVADGMIYASSRKEPVLALRPGGAGDVTDSHLAWKWEGRGVPDVPTPVSDGKYYYMVEDSGMVTCLDAKTGKLIWGPERTAQGTVSASPLLADGKLYITNESGVTTVLAAGPEFKVLATNELDGDYTLASIAVAGSQLFVRTGTQLYCIGKKAE